MVEVTYKTEVLLNTLKEKTLALVLYGTININGVEICKIPLEFDVFMDESYYITNEYDVFIKSWEEQRIQSSKIYVEQILRFYSNVESFKSKLNKSG